MIVRVVIVIYDNLFPFLSLFRKFVNRNSDTRKNSYHVTDKKKKKKKKGKKIFER